MGGRGRGRGRAVRRRAVAPPRGPASWRDDPAFADVVAPLVHDLRWRLRTWRVTSRATAGPVRRMTSTAATAVTIAAMAAAGVSVLVFTIADAYAAPVRWSLAAFT